MLGVARGGSAHACVDAREPERIGHHEPLAQERALHAPATEGGGRGAPVAPARAIRDEECPGACGDAVDPGQEYPPAWIVAKPCKPWLGCRDEIKGAADDPRGSLGAGTWPDALDIEGAGIRELSAFEADKLLPSAGFLEAVLGGGQGAMRHVQEEPANTRCAEGLGGR